MGKVGWCEILIDCEFGAKFVGGWVRDFGQDIVFVGEDEVPDKSR